jgi:hypothetical protein
MTYIFPGPDPHLDLSLALRTLRELSLSDGDLGHEYWTKVYNLLRAAPAMQQRIRELEIQCAHKERRSLTKPGKVGGAGA